MHELNRASSVAETRTRRRGAGGRPQVFDPLDFLAEVTQHIPEPGLGKDGGAD